MFLILLPSPLLRGVMDGLTWQYFIQSSLTPGLHVGEQLGTEAPSVGREAVRRWGSEGSTGDSRGMGPLMFSKSVKGTSIIDALAAQPRGHGRCQILITPSVVPSHLFYLTFHINSLFSHMQFYPFLSLKRHMCTISNKLPKTQTLIYTPKSVFSQI